MKFTKGNVTIDCKAPNNYSIWLREGFTMVDESATANVELSRDELKAKLTKRGIKFSSKSITPNLKKLLG